MASDTEDLDKIIENLKNSVKKSFAGIYASLKARELKTLRQIEALGKQCQENKEIRRNCVQNIKISYENESTLLDNINDYGAIDVERLNFDSSMFTLEDYISPNDDHLYSYKCIEDLATVSEDLGAIEEAALRQITSSANCVCNVNIRSDEVSKQFRDNPQVPKCAECKTSDDATDDTSETIDCHVTDDNSSECLEEAKKIEPTDDWLNSIKSQTETEPSQVTDQMEHSTITCI